MDLNNMTTKESRLYYEGKMLWQEYININGYAFRPDEIGISKLARLLDLNKKYIRKCINVFLDA